MGKTTFIVLLALARAASAQGAGPVITCPEDVTLEADASCVAVYEGPAATATDNEGLSLSFGPDLPVALGGPGEYVITHTATDETGRTASCDQTVTVVDAAPPTVSSAEVTPACLWPPNHKMVAFQLGDNLMVEVTDNCDVAPVLDFANAAGSEPEDGRGDGHSAPDFLAGDEGFCLRSERSGGGHGRTYTVDVLAVDASGNSSEDALTLEVRVPHDQSGHECGALSDDAFIDDESLCGGANMSDEDGEKPLASGCAVVFGATSPRCAVGLLLLGAMLARRFRQRGMRNTK